MIAEHGDWVARDLAHVWHPCTQMREHPDTLPLIPIARGDGAWLIGTDGQRYLDAVSSWWTNIHGHAHPAIAAAIAQQAGQLEHVMLAGFTHAPAIELAERLIDIAPRSADRKPLNRVFYADNGSSAVEVALKLAYHWFVNRGAPERNVFVALENGYHGETLGALSVGDIPLYRKTYAPLLTQAHFTSVPVRTPFATEAEQIAAADAAADALDTYLRDNGAQVCAVIVEPLLQCAGGMLTYHPRWLQRARAACDRHGVFLILDEIATGFGRTGTLFAAEQAGIQPDLMCVSKGLTGGALPLAAVLATEHVYEAFLDDSRERAFLHSHSYTGNPVVCAAALASLKLFEDNDVIGRNKTLAASMQARAQSLRSLDPVADIRPCGMVVAFDLRPGGDWSRSFDPAKRVGLRAYRAALSRGVVLRPLGDVLYWMPPYCVTESELDLLLDVTAHAIREATQ